MATDPFDAFVHSRTSKARHALESFDAEKTRSVWLEELEALYCDVESYLKHYIDEDEISISRDPIQITEVSLGTYAADSLTIKIGFDEINLKPIGTMLIGAYGRVDFSGAQDTLRVVLLPEGGPQFRVPIPIGVQPIEYTSAQPLLDGEIDHKGWYFVTSPPNATAVAFGEESFKDALMEIAGG